MDFRLKIKRDHDMWIDGVKLLMKQHKMSYADIGDLIGVTRQSAWLKLSKNNPLLAIEKEIINKYFNDVNIKHKQTSGSRNS